MNLNKIGQFPENQLKNNNNKLPFINKNPSIINLLHYSNSQLTFFPNRNQIKIYPKNSRIISYGSFGVNIHTKLYRINDYLNRTNKEINPFITAFNFQRTRTVKERNEIKDKENKNVLKADTGLTYTGFYKNKKSGESMINSARISNNILKLNVPKKNIIQNKGIKSESVTSFDEKNDNINIDIDKKEYVIKKLNNYNLNLLKNSRYFSHTKYINQPKNKLNNNKRHMSKSCSTKNISLENTRSTSTVRRTINDIRVEQLLSKFKDREESENKINLEDNSKKKSDIGIVTEKENYKTDPLFYDFIPILLQHLKQKEISDEINKENDLIYNKINSIYYNKNHREKYTTLKTKNGEFLFENPIIKYIFLEKTLYNLRHRVKFVDIKNQDQLEESVLKIIGEEYQNLKEKKYSYDIHDFMTHGYEFDPKLLIKYQQDIQKVDMQNYFKELKTKMNKSIQKNNSTKLSVFSKQGGFFTTNKSEYKVVDKTVKSRNDKSKEKSSSSEGFLSRIFKNQGFKNKIRKFEGLKIRERQKVNENDSNRAQNISKLILKENEIQNTSSEKMKDENIIINDEEMKIKGINKKHEEIQKDAKIIPHPLFQNDRLRLTQPQIQNSVFSSLTKQLMEKEKKRSTNRQKDLTKKFDININTNKDNQDSSKVTTAVKNIPPKEVIKIKITKPQVKKFTVKKIKRKKKLNNSSSKSPNKSKIEVPSSDFNLIRTSVQFGKTEEVKTEKKEIKNIEEYEKYKEEITKENKLIKQSKEKIINEIKKEEKKFSIRQSSDRINEMHYSLKYKRMNTSDFNYGKRFEKIKKEDILDLKESSLLNQMRKMKEINEKKLEEEEEEEEEEDDDSLSDSISSADYDGLDNIDFSKELVNKGEVMKKRWMENSPKFKNRILDFTRIRRHAISASSYEMFDDLSKNEKITKLSDKIKLVYDRLKKKRKAKKKHKRRKNQYFNFLGVDLTKIEEIEKKKKVYLFRLKEDIKYKINEGKYHLIEIENFKHFENAMNKFRLKDSLDPKKVKLYINLVQKYLHYYKVALDNKEREKNDEDRINRFLRNLNQEIYETLPNIKEIKGRYCHSVDYFKELQKLSEIHGFLM